MASQLVGIQRRMMELGRVRLGEKGERGEPRKRDTFRLTSASRSLLEDVARVYGGYVEEWDGAPNEGYYQVSTSATELDIVLPPVFSAADGTPTTAYSQFFELWAAGGCTRRCDGVTDAISGKPCLCNPDERACKITTRVSFMLPRVVGLGVWRLDSHGYNAAVELPGTLDMLLLAAAERQFLPAILRAEQRVKKVPGEGTRRFVVPVIDLPEMRVGELLAGTATLAVNGPTVRPPKPALPAGPGPPAEPQLEHGDPDFPDSPALPGSGPEPLAAGGPALDPAATDEPVVPAAQPSGPDDLLLDGEINQLTADLKTLSRALNRDVSDAILKNRTTHLPDHPEKHRRWLIGQIGRAREAGA